MATISAILSHIRDFYEVCQQSSRTFHQTLHLGKQKKYRSQLLRTMQRSTVKRYGAFQRIPIDSRDAQGTGGNSGAPTKALRRKGPN